MAADTVTDAKQPAFNPPTVAELAPLFPQLEILELIGKGGGPIESKSTVKAESLEMLKGMKPADIEGLLKRVHDARHGNGG